MILPGAASQSLAAELAAETGDALAAVDRTTFADGEFKLRATDAVESGDDRAVVVASTVSAETHVELLQLQEIAARNFAEVVTVLPYMGYARQDEAFRPGEPVSARAVARAVSTGTDRVLTVTPHEASVRELFSVPCEPVEAAGRLAAPLPADLRAPLFLAPDAGAVDLAATVRDAHGAGAVDHFEKRRDRETGAVSMAPAGTEVAGRDVVLVDDIVATGGTASEAIDRLDAPERTFVACVHPLLAGSARTRLARAGVTAIYGTDTVERPVSTVSAAPVVADVL